MNLYRTFLGAPSKASEVDEFKRAIWNLYKDKNEYAAIAFADRVIDRQLNKARGILTFNAILLAAWRFSEHPPLWFTLFPLTSCVLMLRVCWVHWGDASTYASLEQEFNVTIDIGLRRSRMIAGSIWISFVSLALLLYWTAQPARGNEASRGTLRARPPIADLE